jgi:hypothetical protein
VKLSPTNEFILLGCSRGNTNAEVREKRKRKKLDMILFYSLSAKMYTITQFCTLFFFFLCYRQKEITPWQHPVAAVWRLGDMKRMSTLVSRTDLNEEDDANVALFHPKPGAGVVYGTKQGHIACALNADVLLQSKEEYF